MISSVFPSGKMSNMPSLILYLSQLKSNHLCPHSKSTRSIITVRNHPLMKPSTCSSRKMARILSSISSTIWSIAFRLWVRPIFRLSQHRKLLIKLLQTVAVAPILKLKKWQRKILMNCEQKLENHWLDPKKVLNKWSSLTKDRDYCQVNQLSIYYIYQNLNGFQTVTHNLPWLTMI